MQTTINPAAGPDAARLALKLVEWNYGPLCKDVITTLVKHGRQTFAELRHLSKIPTEALRTALVVLIQQNCVSVYLHSSESNRKTEQLYEATIDRMLQIIRMPRFLEHVAAKFNDQPHGDTCKAIVQTLLFHGRLQMGQLPHALRSLRSSTGTAAPATDSEPHPDPDPPKNILKAVRALVDAKYVERVPPCTLPPPPNHVHTKARKKKAAPKAGSEEDLLQQWEASKQQQRQAFQNVRFDCKNHATLAVFEAAAGADAQADQAQAADADAAGPSTQGGKRAAAGGGSSGSGPAAKRAKGANGAVKVEDEGRHQTPSEVVLWRVNYEELNRRLRDAEIVELVNQQHGEEAALVVEALLSETQTIDPQDYSESDGPPVSVESVLSASKRLHGAKAVALPRIRAVLRELSSMSLPMVVCNSTDRGFYCAAFGNATGVLRTGTVLAVIEHRFGESAKRIWNMLLLDGQMEQKAIADAAMVPNAEAREALYALLNDGYLSLQDIPRNADRAPSRTFYTWRATVQGASARLSSQLYRSAGNLLARMAAETRANAELLRRVELVNEGRMDSSQLDGDALAQLKGSVRVLETSLVRLDKKIGLFNDM